MDYKLALPPAVSLYRPRWSLDQPSVCHFHLAGLKRCFWQWQGPPSGEYWLSERSLTFVVDS